jgi:TPR repeat protein
MNNSCKTILIAILMLFPFATYAEKSDKKLSLTLEADVSTHIENAFDYYFGDGVEIKEDNEIAFTWITRSAESGFAEAQDYLGDYYRLNDASKEGLSKTKKWYLSAAKQGYLDSQYKLARTYYSEKNYVEAVEWYFVAAEKGYDFAQYNLALMFQLGQGVKVNNAEAYYWYQNAANAGHLKSQYNLATMYLLGHGIKKDPIKAESWFRKTAERGMPEGQMSLGSMYLNEDGVKKDELKAFLWMKLAYDQGVDSGREQAFMDLKSGLSDLVVAEGEKLAMECVKLKYNNCY